MRQKKVDGKEGAGGRSCVSRDDIGIECPCCLRAGEAARDRSFLRLITMRLCRTTTHQAPTLLANIPEHDRPTFAIPAGSLKS